MGWPQFMNWERCAWIFLRLLVVFSVPACHGITDPRDVFAINSLYAGLGFPLLPGWVPVGGDPCADAWQGVQCVNTNITEIVLNGANLGGELNENLGQFVSVIQIDLSNNHIGGSIPANLPITIRSLFLSGNQFTGSIPDTLSTLGQLSDLSFNDNHLTGQIPDAFQQLTGLINLDFSGNNLSGQLPPSMGNLASLTTLHLQNNQLIGTLDVLQDVPLRDLNIENNLFSGPIPEKLLNIPNFRRSGNPFNTTVIPSPPVVAPLPTPPFVAPLPTPSAAPSPELTPGKQAFGPSAPIVIPDSSTGGKLLTAKKVTWIVIAGVLILTMLAVGLCLFLFRCCKGSQPATKIAKRHEIGAYNDLKEKPKNDESFTKLYCPTEKGHEETCFRPANRYGKDQERSGLRLKPEAKQEEIKRMTALSKNKEDHAIDMTGLDVDILLPPPPPPPFLSIDEVTVTPVLSQKTSTKLSNKTSDSLRSFTIALLQQYTNSFSQENLIGGGMLGTVYRAEIPTGKQLAVKKLNTSVNRKQSNEDFLELVSSVSKLRHPNLVELLGYCSEYGQRLLVYEYCGNGTLHEALHLDDEIHKKLSWNNRVRIAVGAARALEYLHEVCHPPIVHQNFKSANILLDDELIAHISDCGLAPLISSVYLYQVSGNGYGAPELELGSYTSKSDVYSFGVVMLEILTGRKSYDRSRPRGEQYLVRWAIPQLHDIDALSKMVDPYLNGAYPSKSLSRFADTISLCLQPEPEFRPPMSEIVQNLLHMI